MVYLTEGNKVFTNGLGMGQSAPSVYGDDTKPGGGTDRPEDLSSTSWRNKPKGILGRPAAGNASSVAVAEQSYAPGEAGDQPTGNWLGRKGPGGPGGHKTDLEPRMYSCRKGS